MTLDDFRAREIEIKHLREGLGLKHPNQSLHFPFALSDKRPLRPTQFYMTKFPIGVAKLFPDLDEALKRAARGEARDEGTGSVRDNFGAPYTIVNVEQWTEVRAPYLVDSGVLDRANKSHFTTQNSLADWLKEHEYQPLSPEAQDPKFDLAWRHLERVYVAEVKSTTDFNEEQQLRLGLGQVLRYRHLLSRRFGNANTIAVLVAERAPKDTSWGALCASLGVVFIRPGFFSRLQQEP